MSNQISQAIHLIEEAKHVVALTGAGISTPSGIPDFRSASSGLWNNVDLWEVATFTAFKRRPHLFYDWIRPLIRTIWEARPNPAHLALAELERLGKLHSIITQNIDILHSRAGSQTVYEIHGHLRDMVCLRCYRTFAADTYLAHLLEEPAVPHCPVCGGLLKPAVILFEEQLPFQTLLKAKEESTNSDLMLVIGTSLEVEPASELPALARSTGSRLIIINQSATYIDKYADLVIRGDVAEILPQLIKPSTE